MFTVQSFLKHIVHDKAMLNMITVQSFLKHATIWSRWGVKSDFVLHDRV